ncbi:hypothetical protein DFO66_103381 [Brevibacterium sanguinis]|uniref:Uncharacterized protein n=2 Tax=Brevibacterium TaxID=1696 RepID=A0A366IKX3_9MICO|nr:MULTISPECIES: hypothetical protein [Brevibacterium]RBP66431.1 hypothetical protein DFO66_103381 [Brevibacterium sanguinis]RBP73083.1 hypothetical protein DFO65_103381 [Brevibacterium celere]
MVDLQPYDGTPVTGSKLSWLGSREGVATARTGTLAGFTGVVRSGTPVAEVAGEYVAYDSATNTLAGFVLHDTAIREGRDTPTAILDRGRIRVDRLPVAFTPPTDKGRFAFVSDS